ncbi:MAG: hypothetical protein ABJF65_00400 [Reichenbachiella sp.]|uniref:hypothetical protein n=1 Tax=Reichenbachiella sp. TaxID=2184521 RepID=UPI0032642BAD
MKNIKVLIVALLITGGCNAQNNKLEEAEKLAKEFSEHYYSGRYDEAMKLITPLYGMPLYDKYSATSYKPIYDNCKYNEEYVFKQLVSFYAPCRYYDRRDNIDKYIVVIDVNGWLSDIVIEDREGELKVRNAGNIAYDKSRMLDNRKVENISSYRLKIEGRIEKAMEFKQKQQ